MGGEVRHEFDDGHFVVFVAQWEGECYPDGGADYEKHEQKQRTPRRPVERPSPEFLKFENKLFLFRNKNTF